MQNERSQMQQSAYLTLGERQIYLLWSKGNHRSPRTPVGREAAAKNFNEAYRWWKIVGWYIGTFIMQVRCIINIHKHIHMYIYLLIKRKRPQKWSHVHLCIYNSWLSGMFGDWNVRLRLLLIDNTFLLPILQYNMTTLAKISFT